MSSAVTRATEPAPARDSRPLRALVGANRLELGGMQLNAIDLARAVRSLRHEGLPVPQSEGDRSALAVVESHGLDVELVPPSGRRALPPASAWGRLAHRYRIDVLHAYGSWMGWAAFLGPTAGACHS